MRTTIILLSITIASYLWHVEAQTVKKSLTAQTWQSYNSVSATWVNDNLEAYTYNDAGKVTTSTYKTWNAITNSYRQKSLITFGYINNILDTKTYSTYDENLAIWVDTLRRTYTFSPEGWLLTTEIAKRPNNTSPWQPTALEERFYDANGNNTELYFYSWDKQSSVWENVEKNICTYDASNRILTYTSWVWDDIFGLWVYFDKEEYEYIDATRTTNYTYWLFDEYTNQWVYILKDKGYYSTDGLTWGYLSYYWDTVKMVWVDFTKELHYLDAAGRILRYAEYEWNTTTLKWDYYDQEEYLYDGFGNVLQFIDYNKDITYNQWVESLKETYQYNNLIGSDQLVLPFDEPIINNVYFNSQILGANSFTWVSSAWKNSSKGAFQYDDITVTIDNSPIVPTIKLFPNPVGNQLFVATDAQFFPITVNIYNQLGVLVMSEQWVDQCESISTQMLPHGIYIVKCKLGSQGAEQTHQLVKR